MRSLFLTLAILLGSLAVNSQNLSNKSQQQVEEAQLYYEAGRYEEALQLIKKVLFRTTRQPDLQIFAARCYLAMNDPYNAERHLRKASKIGSYKADLLLDSLRHQHSPALNEEFKNDLEEYLQETAPEPKR